jgi:zinc protease
MLHRIRLAGRRRFHLLATLAGSALLLMAGAGCAARSGVGGAPQVKLDYEKYQLANGLEVILRKDSRLPIVAVNLWYHVGPANETAGRTGFAHLFEHMMFQGSGHVGDDQYFKYLEGAGASFVNGTTDFDRTNYLEDVPANQLELALWLESDRMGFLLDRLDQAMLSNQQDVVRNERRQSIENAPYSMGQEEVYHLLFPEQHPYRAMVIGSHTDIQAARLEDVHDFFRRYYAPNNASLAIVGDIDVPKTKALVEKYFGTIPRGPAMEPVSAKTPAITAERRKVVTDKVELPRAYLAWITDPIFKPGDAEAAIAARILGGGKASRLYKRLVYDKKIAQTVTAEQQSLALGSVFQITATAKPGHAAEVLEAEIDAELAAMAQSGPTPEELDAAKNAISSQIVLSLENLGGFSGVADRLNMYNQHLKDPGYLNRDLERYQAVTAEGVKRVASDKLAKNARVVVHVLPGEKVVPPGPPTPPPVQKVARQIDSKEPWRSQVPKPGPLSTAPLPSARRFALSNGLQVYLVEAHALPIVTAYLAVRSGSAADPIQLPGLAGFTASMLDEGTTTRDALGIARDVEALGSSLSTGTSTDGSSVFSQSLKKNSERALAIMSEVALQPTFPATEVDRVRNDRLTALLQQRDSPFQTAFKVMWSCLYGPDHPYGHVTLGTGPALQKMKREDLESFYRTHFTPANAALILAGDLSEGEAKRLAEAAFGSWKGGGREVPRPAAGVPAPEKVLIVDKKGAPQTAVVVAQLGVTRADPDYEKLNVMNQVLGGLFSSRVNMNLRERHGYSYGAFSFVSENRAVGPIIVGASVREDVTGASVREMMNEVATLRQQGITEEELKLAKESIARSLPALFETTQSTVGTIGQLYLYELPPDYYEALPKRLDAITGDEVKLVASKHLRPDEMKVIAVGDRARIERQLEALALGPIGYRTADAEPVVSEPVP